MRKNLCIGVARWPAVAPQSHSVPKSDPSLEQRAPWGGLGLHGAAGSLSIPGTVIREGHL